MYKEDWKYTSLDEWKKQSFEKTALKSVTVVPHFFNDAINKLVFVNGVYDASQSNVAVDEQADFFNIENDLIAELNAENQTAKVHVKLSDEITIHVFHVIEGKQVMSAPLIEISVAKNSQVKVIEHFSGSGIYSHCQQIVFNCERDAVVEHEKIQNDSLEAFHLSTIHVNQEQNSQFKSTQIQLGSKLCRQEIVVNQNAEHCAVELNGLFITRDKQHHDTHTKVNHKFKYGKSVENYKGIAADKSRAVFNGKIVVSEGADGIDSSQSNKNLLLSSQAEIDAKPELEIYADEVKCAHGATVGELNEQSLFYLQSRGIPLEKAKSLLLHAFAADVLESLENEAIREYCIKLVDEDLWEIEHGMA